MKGTTRRPFQQVNPIRGRRAEFLTSATSNIDINRWAWVRYAVPGFRGGRSDARLHSIEGGAVTGWVTKDFIL